MSRALGVGPQEIVLAVESQAIQPRVAVSLPSDLT